MGNLIAIANYIGLNIIGYSTGYTPIGPQDKFWLWATHNLL